MILKSNGSILAAAALFGGVMAVAGAVHATSIGVQFYDTADGSNAALTPTQSAGYGAYAQANFNTYNASGAYESAGTYVFSGSISTLVDASGAASVGANGGSVTFSFANGHKFNHTSGSFNSATATPNMTLMSDGIENDSHGISAATTATFGNVAPGKYSLLVYIPWNIPTLNGNPEVTYAQLTVTGSSTQSANFNEQQASEFDSNPVFVTNPNPATPSGTTDLSNYALFTGISPDANGNITISLDKPSGTSYGPSIGMDAFQLVSAPVPEPATLALFGAAGVGILLLSKRRPAARCLPRRSC